MQEASRFATPAEFVDNFSIVCQQVLAPVQNCHAYCHKVCRCVPKCTEVKSV